MRLRSINLDAPVSVCLCCVYCVCQACGSTTQMFKFSTEVSSLRIFVPRRQLAVQLMNVSRSSVVRIAHVTSRRRHRHHCHKTHSHTHAQLVRPMIVAFVFAFAWSEAEQWNLSVAKHNSSEINTQIVLPLTIYTGGTQSDEREREWVYERYAYA